MKVIELEQAIATEVVNKLEKGGYSPLVAGGAPRSWYMGEACNDIDVFIQADKEWIDNVQDMVGFELERKGEDYQEQAGLLEAVYEGTYQGKTIQIMFLSTPPEEYIHNFFPFVVCKFWFKDGQVCSTWDARLSLDLAVNLPVNGGKFSPEYEVKLVQQLDMRQFRENWEQALTRPLRPRVANFVNHVNPWRIPDHWFNARAGIRAEPEVAWVDDAVPDERG